MLVDEQGEGPCRERRQQDRAVDLAGLEQAQGLRRKLLRRARPI
jgi:hypothetical protein